MSSVQRPLGAGELQAPSYSLYTAWRPVSPAEDLVPRPMNQAAYVRHNKNHGSVCPVCKCDDVEGGQCDVSCGSVEQEITCLGCQAVWVDVYTLTSYELTLNPADEEKDEPDQ